MMPGIQNKDKWLDILRVQMIAKGKEEWKLRLQNLKIIVGIAAVGGAVIGGAVAGATVGALLGVPGGPVGAIAGGGALGGALGGAAMAKTVNAIKEKDQNKRKEA